MTDGTPQHVLFLCVGNSARSQMAEGLARSLLPASVKISSAGSEPSDLKPEAIRAMQEIGIDISGQRAKGINEIDTNSVDLVVTLCADQACPVLPSSPRQVHWGLPDPAAVNGNGTARMEAFRTARDELKLRIGSLLEPPAQPESPFILSLQSPNPTSAFSLTLSTQIGTWSILAASLALGLIVSGSFGVDALLMLGAVLTAFLARHAAGRRMRLPPGDQRRKPLGIWIAAYAAAAVLLAAVLAVWFERWLIVLFVPAALLTAGLLTILEARKQDRTAAGELLGMLGLSLAAPLAFYSTTGELSIRALGLFLLCMLFFSGSVFHVRYLARRHAGWPSAVYHILAPAAAWVLSLVDIVPVWAPLALLPAAAWALWAVGRPGKTRIPIRRIGYLEAAHTIVFVALAAGAFYL